MDKALRAFTLFMAWMTATMPVFPQNILSPILQPAPSAASCASMPSFNASYLSTSVSTGFTTWPDSSGNSNTATGFTGAATVVDTSNPTPNGTKTYVLNNTAGQSGTLTSAITTSTSMTVCAVWNMTSTSGSFQFTGNTNAGAFEAGINTSGFQYFNKGFTTAGPTSASATSLNTWYSGCWIYTNGTSTPYLFYLNGTTNGTGTATLTMSQPIAWIFKDRTSALPIGNVAELDIKNATISSAEQTGWHSCMVFRYGVS